MNKIIFSYCRVSTQEQSSSGLGLENQKLSNENAIESLMANDPLLQRGKDIEEVGSAFSGKNFSRVFEMVDHGKLPVGSIVVLFDETRFTREDPLDALVKLRDLVRKGINLYFSAKSKLVTQNNVSSFHDYIVHLAVGAAANEESISRSNRTKASYNRKVANNELVTSGALPNWMKKIYDEGKIIGIEAIPEREKVLKNIFDMYIKGKGATTIVKWLNENVDVWPEHHDRVKANKNVNKLENRWTESYITRLLKDRRLIGERVFYSGTDSEKVSSKYYPEIINKTKFYQAQEIRRSRSKNKTPSMKKYPPIIYMGLARCGYCGGRIAVQQYTNKKPTIRCARHSKGEENLCAGGSSQARYLEQVIIELCKDKVNYNSLYLTKDESTEKLKAEQVELIHNISKLNEKLEKVEDLYLDQTISKERYVIRQKALNEDLTQANEKLNTIERKIDTLVNTSTTIDDDFRELINKVKTDSIDIETRLKLKNLLPQFISEIQVYRYGLFAKPKVTKKQREELIKKYGKDSFQVIKIAAAPKDKDMLLYRVIFKNEEYSRYILFNKGNWKYVNSFGGNTGIEVGGEYNVEDLLF